MMSSFLSPPMSETTLEGCWLKELTLLLCCFHQKDDWRRNGVWQRLFLLYPSNPENKGRFFRHNLERLKEWRAIWDLGWKEQGSMLASVFCRSSSAAKTIDIFFPSEEFNLRKAIFFYGQGTELKAKNLHSVCNSCQWHIVRSWRSCFIHLLISEMRLIFFTFFC